MDLQKQIERLKKVHKLILEEKTGNRNQFADKLRVSENQLYSVITTLKEFDAPIKYSKKLNSFYYTKPFELELKFSLTIMIDEEKRVLFE